MPKPQAKHVFISYSRRDDAIMRRIVEHLRAQGINAWVDNEKLVPGTPVWEYEIEKAIKSAFAIVVILSPDAKKSEWVLREITLADQFNKRAFPVLVTGKNEDSIPFRLITHQFVDIRKDEATGLNSLSSAISFYMEELTRLEEERQAAEREIERLKQEREMAEIAARKAEEKAENERKAKEQAEQLAQDKAEEERIAKAKLEAERIASKKAETERKKREAAEHTANAKLEDKDTAREKPPQKIEGKQSFVSIAFKKLVSQGKPNKYVFTGLLILAGFVVILGINQFIETKNANNAAFVNATSTAAAKTTNTAKAESISTASAKGTNIAAADANSTNTAFWAAARSTNTALADIRSTSTAFFAASRATNTAKAESTSAALVAEAFMSIIQSGANLVYGPRDGSLNHDENDNNVEISTASIDDLDDFIIEATFLNPYSTLIGSWSYGFLFRDEGGNQQYRLIVSSKGYWRLSNHTGEGSGTEVQTGDLVNLDISDGGANTIWLYAQGGEGVLYINGNFVANLDLSARTNSGDVRIGTGFFTTDEIDGYRTGYTDFSVWEIP